MAFLALPMRSRPHETVFWQWDNSCFYLSRSKANLSTLISHSTLTCVYKCLTLKNFKSWGKDGPSLWLNFEQVARTCSKRRVTEGWLRQHGPPFYIVLAVFPTDLPHIFCLDNKFTFSLASTHKGSCCRGKLYKSIAFVHSPKLTSLWIKPPRP